MAASPGRRAVSAATRPDASRRTGPVVALLAGAVFLNYFDRGTLATASPLLQGEFGLTNAEMGILFSAFFWSYAPL